MNENISTYNVIEQIDLATVSWSSIGLEIRIYWEFQLLQVLKDMFQLQLILKALKSFSLEEYYAFFKKKK